MHLLAELWQCDLRACGGVGWDGEGLLGVVAAEGENRFGFVGIRTKVVFSSNLTTETFRFNFATELC